MEIALLITHYRNTTSNICYHTTYIRRLRTKWIQPLRRRQKNTTRVYYSRFLPNNISRNITDTHTHNNCLGNCQLLYIIPTTKRELI